MVWDFFNDPQMSQQTVTVARIPGGSAQEAMPDASVDRSNADDLSRGWNADETRIRFDQIGSGHVRHSDQNLMN